MLHKLFASTKKNLLRLMRQRVSAAAIIFGPLLLIIVIGLAFSNTKLHDIKVGTYVPEENEYITNIIGNLENSKDTFTVKEYETNESCIESVKDGASHICVTFVKDPASPKINAAFYVDYSRLSLVLILINAMNDRVTQESSQIGEDISRSLLERVSVMNQYVESNGKVVEGISQNSAQMLESLRGVRTQISGLDLSNPVDASSLGNVSAQTAQQRRQITAQQKEVSSQIAEAKAEVRSTREELDRSRTDLEQTMERLDAMDAQLTESMEILGCTGTYEDITGIVDDEAALREALATPDAPCKVMYSAKLNVDQMQAEGAKVQEQLDTGYEQLEDAEDQLTAFEKEYAAATSDALQQLDYAEKQLGVMSAQIKAGDAKISEMKSTRQSLINQLDAAEASMQSSNAMIDGVKTGLADVKASLGDVESVTPEAIVRPFTTSVNSVTSTKRQFDFLFPSLLALVIMFVSLLAASTIVMKEKGSRAYFRNLIMPSPTFTFFSGVLLTSTILASLQIVVILAIGSFFFDVALFTNPLLLIISLLLGITLFSLVGIIYGFLFSSEETTTLVSIMSGVILFFFSSIVIPMESMDPTLASIARFNPFVILETLLRHSLIFDDAAIWVPLGIILAQIAALFIITIYAIRWARQNA